MRRLLPALLVLSACADPPRVPLPTEPEGPVPTNYAVSGAVYDSVLGYPLGGVRLFLGDSNVVTDPDGNYRLQVAAGNLPLVVADPDYEPVSRTEPVGFNRNLNVGLRRYAPYPVDCALSGDTLYARVIDLQGRKSVNRRAQTTVTVAGTDFSTRYTAYAIRWLVEDGLTWQVFLPLGRPGATEAVWHVEDNEGFVVPTRCLLGAPPCHGCAPPRPAPPAARPTASPFLHLPAPILGW